MVGMPIEAFFSSFEMTYHSTKGAGSWTGVSAGQTRTANSMPLADLKVWSVKPRGVAGGKEAMLAV